VLFRSDGGQNWRKIEKLPGVPDLTYVTDVLPSPVDVNTVFVTVNDFQRGNFKPYVLKSADLGKTWTSIAGDLPRRDPTWTIVQDQVNPNLLFLGTEFGLYFTVEGGAHWMALKNGLPPISIRDWKSRSARATWWPLLSAAVSLCWTISLRSARSMPIP
jgi:hypothetical protein